MAIIAIKAQDEEVTRQYFAGVAARLHVPNLYLNPFKGAVRTYRRRGELLGVVLIEPIYPPVWLASFLFIALGGIFNSAWLFAPALFFLALGVLWHPTFYVLMLKRGLRKAGYQGRVQHLTALRAWRWQLGAN